MSGGTEIFGGGPPHPIFFHKNLFLLKIYIFNVRGPQNIWRGGLPPHIYTQNVDFD